MSTSWSLTAGQICRDALEHLEAIGVGETMSADDLNVALRALDSVLKELPLSGYAWPKLSGETALAWSSTTPGVASLPADFYGYASIWKSVNGKPVPLKQIMHSYWINMNDRSATATQPTHFYISPDNTLYFWPIPTADPQATLQYQRLVSDASATAAPDMPQYWLNALGYGVANELKFKFGVNPQKGEAIRLTWEQKKTLALDSSDDDAPVFFSVDD